MHTGIHDRPRRATIAVTVAVLAAACFVAFSPAAAGAAVQASSVVGDEVGAPISWGVCDPLPPPDVDLQCARMAVPLDWKDPGGRTISLAVIRLRAKPDKRIGTLFINPGGPGDTGVGLLRGDPAGVAAIGGGRFDVVSWDPRGSNASTRVLCFTDQREEARFWAGASIPITRAGSEQMLRLIADLAKRCGEVSGWLLPHISTADTARDLDHLRVLLGEEKLTYVGLSYGSYLGQTYANMFPDRVRAMLLDGIIDAVEYSKSAEARMVSSVGGADAVFGQFLSLCESAGPERCALAAGGQTPAERVESLFAQVKGTPIPAPGVRPPLLSPWSLSYSDLLLSQFQPMRAPSTWEGNAADLDAAIRGDASALASVASGFLSPAGWAPAITSAAIQCADAPADQSPQAWPEVIGRLKQVSRLQGVVQGWWEWAPCASWPIRGQDNYRGPWNRSTPNPILLINQTYDPNTGHRNAVHAEHYLGNAILLTQEGYGHLFFQDPSKCVEDKMVDYLVHLITPPPGTVCQSDHKPFDPHLKSGTESPRPGQVVEQDLP
ncbi:MAG: alpha/beta fold hydrolase [Bryobacteraceae bacterium]|jgi:pimeloyl-ACP methyl ester carboxylesterase